MRRDLEELEQMVMDALSTGNFSTLEAICPDGNLSPITPVAEQLIEDLIVSSRDMDSYLGYFAQTVKGDPELEQAFSAAVKTSIPELLKKPHFVRLTYVLQACADNPALWEPAINNESFKEFVQKWTREKDHDSLARLKAMCTHLSIDLATFGFDTNTGYHLYNIGAQAKEDLIITTHERDYTGNVKFVCHTNGFSGSPRDLIRHWCDADQTLQKARKMQLDFKLEERAYELAAKMLGKNSPLQSKLAKYQSGKSEKIPDNHLLGSATNKTIFLLAALAGLREQNPGLNAAYEQVINDIEQMIPS